VSPRSKQDQALEARAVHLSKVFGSPPQWLPQIWEMETVSSGMGESLERKAFDVELAQTETEQFYFPYTYPLHLQGGGLSAQTGFAGTRRTSGMASHTALRYDSWGIPAGRFSSSHENAIDATPGKGAVVYSLLTIGCHSELDADACSVSTRIDVG
jgi:hypothetical protein